jgi:hypothetical protein
MLMVEAPTVECLICTDTDEMFLPRWLSVRRRGDDVLYMLSPGVNDFAVICVNNDPRVCGLKRGKG